jgi:hypothetical protein
MVKDIPGQINVNEMVKKFSAWKKKTKKKKNYTDRATAASRRSVANLCG